MSNVDDKDRPATGEEVAAAMKAWLELLAEPDTDDFPCAPVLPVHFRDPESEVMLTRRSFLGTLAALSASRVAPVPVAAEPLVTGYILSVGGRPLATPYPLYGGSAGGGKSMRRDDGDTILELR
jgi:hypothetical protein